MANTKAVKEAPPAKFFLRLKFYQVASKIIGRTGFQPVPLQADAWG
jgi:hypothetical protein